MKSFRDYLTNRVDKLATQCGLDVYQAAEWGDCGWWIFKDDSGATRAKLYYDFHEGHCTVREGKGFLYDGVICRYGNDADEKKLLDFVESKFFKGASLDSVLGNATERSQESDANMRCMQPLLKDEI